MVFFTFVLFAAESWFQSDSQLFQVIASILTGVTGAFLARIKPDKTESSSTAVVQSGPDATVNIPVTPPAQKPPAEK